jgi:hypothetical protein
MAAVSVADNSWVSFLPLGIRRDFSKGWVQNVVREISKSTQVAQHYFCSSGFLGQIQVLGATVDVVVSLSSSLDFLDGQ